MSQPATIDRLWSLIRQLQGALGGNRVVAGIVDSSGNPVSGMGFTSARTGTGLYTVSFDVEFSDSPAVTATPVASGATPWTCNPTSRPSTSSVSLRCVAGGSNTDLEFSFTAVGPP